MSNSETILWNDGAINPDSVLTVEIKREVTEVLGYNCDEVILTCKSGLQKYYFNSNLSVDPSLFSRHAFGNWYEYLKVAKALPLKSVVDNIQFTLTTLATEVNEMKIEDNALLLPENVTITKSPY